MTHALPELLPTAFALKSSLLFSRNALLGEDAWLVVDAGRIVELAFGARPPQSCAAFPCFDLEDAAISPGLNNAHTHLEFSDLKQPLGQPGMKLPDWIRLVIAERSNTVGDGPGDVTQATQSLTAGLAESLRAGVTRLGEIATARWSLPPIADSPLDVIAFREMISTDPRRADELLQAACEEPFWCEVGEAARSQTATCAPGLSPHAPYSTSMDLVQRSVELAKRRGWPVAMHLAESPEEMDYLATGDGAFRQLLDELGVWHGEAFHLPVRPLDYLRVLSGAPQSYIIHGNFLNEDELRFLADHRERMTLVYCPRTHAYFGHAPHPAARALEMGVRLAIGTDSRASNPNLNLFEELQFLAAHTDIPRSAILDSGTKPWTARQDDRSSFRVGDQATFAIVALASTGASDPFERLLHPKSQVTATVIRGQVCARRGMS
ncbi:MAG: amidohydrolase family protein [Pirellulales bacterium]|nr:amidohydrolase family protein [Pirellulales bacterium]